MNLSLREQKDKYIFMACLNAIEKEIKKPEPDISYIKKAIKDVWLEHDRNE